MKIEELHKYKCPLQPNYLLLTLLEKCPKKKHLRHKLSVAGTEKDVHAEPLAKNQCFESLFALGRVSRKHNLKHFVN